MKIQPVIRRYIDQIVRDEFHRYRSWDHCHHAFAESEKNERHALELAFYLASWGMYRGSGGLLQKNHLIHRGAVDILFSNEWTTLKCSQENEVTKNHIDKIISLKQKLSAHYQAIPFTRSGSEEKAISPTDTLLSKIMLGSFGCVPAYDRYFVTGLKIIGMQYRNFDAASLRELFDFADKNYQEVKIAQQNVQDKAGRYYPVMKILDMFFWQVGYDEDINGKG